MLSLFIDKKYKQIENSLFLDENEYEYRIVYVTQATQTLRSTFCYNGISSKWQQKLRYITPNSVANGQTYIL